uniref:Uncharacterized protein n=2 Tax=unclassified Caudoviricetes TaxID=2788787 RepID=A0AAU8HXZ0_9CAUD
MKTTNSLKKEIAMFLSIPAILLVGALTTPLAGIVADHLFILYSHYAG